MTFMRSVNYCFWYFLVITNSISLTSSVTQFRQGAGDLLELRSIDEVVRQTDLQLLHLFREGRVVVGLLERIFEERRPVLRDAGRGVRPVENSHPRPTPSCPTSPSPRWPAPSRLAHRGTRLGPWRVTTMGSSRSASCATCAAPAVVAWSSPRRMPSALSLPVIPEMTDILSHPNASAKSGAKKGLLAPTKKALPCRSAGRVQPSRLSTTNAVELAGILPRSVNFVQSKLAPSCLKSWAAISVGPCPQRMTVSPSGRLLVERVLGLDDGAVLDQRPGAGVLLDVGGLDAGYQVECARRAAGHDDGDRLSLVEVRRIFRRGVTG